ncbi:MAG: hypothetical protein LBI31_03195 [Zoogloeaceae bacterium]|nr:hypothetical protein [Zoogloeaceae bacterium]
MATLLATGCTTTVIIPFWENPNEVVEAVTVSDREFDSSVTFNGPEVWNYFERTYSSDNLPAYNASLMAMRDKKTGKVRHLVKIRWNYRRQLGPMSLRSPKLINGSQSLPSTHDIEEDCPEPEWICERETRGRTRCKKVEYICRYFEKLITSLPDGFLERATTGVKLSYSGSNYNGTFFVEFSQIYVTGFLAGVAENMKPYEKPAKP